MFHGGGWFGGSPLSTARLAEYLADNGVVVFNSTYRTSTGGYPESFDDIACAIRDARTEASEYTTSGRRSSDCRRYVTAVRTRCNAPSRL